jgi:hypothetical protein
VSVRYPVPTYRGFQQRRGSTAIYALASDVTGDYELDCQPASYAVTGADAAGLATRVVDAQPASYALTGSAATLARGLFLNVQPDLFVVTGVEALTARALELDCQPGSFAVSGVAAEFVYGQPAESRNTAIRVAAHTPKQRAQVSQVLSGLAATSDYTIDAEPGSYAVTGVDASLFTGIGPSDPRNTAIRVRAHTPKQRAQVSQVLSGLTPTAVNDYQFEAEPGTYAVTGAEADLNFPLTWDKVVVPTYAHSPQQIMFGARVFGGVQVLGTGYELDAQPATFAVTGTDASFLRALALDAATASYAVTGSDATLARGLFINAATGSFTVTGVAATLVASGAISADPGTVTVTGFDVTFVLSAPQDHVLSVDPAVYTITGVRTQLIYPGELWVDHSPGSVTFADHDLVGAVTFTDHASDVVLFTDHTPD